MFQNPRPIRTPANWPNFALLMTPLVLAGG
jgi:hypothetical protein